MKFLKSKFSQVMLYIIALTILIMVFSGVLIWRYSTNIIEDYQSEMVNNFQQNVLKNVDKNYNQMLKATMQIFDDSCIRDFLMFEKENEEQIAQAQRNYQNYLFYFDLEEIFIINKRTDSIWNNIVIISKTSVWKKFCRYIMKDTILSMAKILILKTMVCITYTKIFRAIPLL